MTQEKPIFESILKRGNNLSFENPEKLAIDLIYETAEEIKNEPTSTAELESKIILSIAIRLKAEEFMIRKISDKSLTNSIKSNQTLKLLKHFKQKFPYDKDALPTLDRVNLMTPENIHINSFMYEPILDMSPNHLITLYRDVTKLNTSQ
jgi:hypothetical protein